MTLSSRRDSMASLTKFQDLSSTSLRTLCETSQLSPMADTSTHLNGPSPVATPGREHRLGVVVNGNARSVTADVIATLDEVLDSGDIFLSRRIEESDAIARTLLDRGYDTILTAGGDGTFTVIVTAVVNEARKRGVAFPRFGLLSLGTGNSLAWVLGASRTKKGRRGARALTV